MTTDVVSPLILDIAREFISLMRRVEPDWRKAYLRFSWKDHVSVVEGSYEHASDIEILQVTKHPDFVGFLVDAGQALFAGLGKTEGLLLLTIDSSFDYECEFEYRDFSRWSISKLDGGTGVPVGSK